MSTFDENYKPTDSGRYVNLKQDKYTENHSKAHHNQIAKNQ
jgi:hypothetical protein